MAKIKFVYQSYDYSFLKPKDPWYIPICRKVFAKTIGNDMVTVKSMDLPSGKLFYFDYELSEESKNNVQFSYSNRTNPIDDFLYDWVALHREYLNNNKKK